MYIYLLIVFFMLITRFFFGNTKICLFSWFIILSVVSGIRSINVGVDTGQYYRAYSYITFISGENRNLIRYEPGYFYLNKLVSLFTIDPQVFIFITAVIINFGIYLFIRKNSSNYLVSSLVYLLFGIYGAYMNVIRQALAIVILLYAFELLKKNKFVFSVVITFLASFFHSSALIFLLGIIVVIVLKKIDSIVIILGILLSIVCIPMSKILFKLGTDLIGKYTGYENSVHYNASNVASSINYTICLCLLISGWIIIKKYQYSLTNTDRIVIIMILIQLIISGAGVRTYIIYRMEQYFRIFQLLWIPLVINAIPGNKYSKLLTPISLLIMGLFYFIVIGLMRPEWQGIIPYSTFFQ